MLIQNRQLENSFYEKYILYCVKLEQEQDQIIPEIFYFSSNLQKVRKTNVLINISRRAVPSQDNKRNIIYRNNYPISIIISLISLQYQEKQIKINNAKIKSNIQNISIQNRRLKNNFYQRYILYYAKLKQEENQIIPEIFYFPNDSQKVEKINAPTNISEIVIPSQDNRKNIIDTNNYPISIGISLISLYKKKKLRKTKNNQDQIISYSRNNAQVICDKSENKTMYIIKWLKNINEMMNITKDTKPTQSISKQSSVIHDHNQSIHISCNNDNPLQSILNINTINIRARGKREKNLEDYDKVCNFNSIITYFTNFYWLKNLI